MRILISILLVMFVTPIAQAGVHIEPYIGYSFGGAYEGKISGDYPAPIGTITDGDIDEEIDGALFGAKLGYSFWMMSVGADYMTGTIEGEGVEIGTGDPYDVEYDTTHMGAFVEFRLPAFAKFSFTYFLTSEFDDEGQITKGSGTKFGVGLTFLPWVVINVDMISVTHDDFEDEYLTAVDLEYTTTMVGISLPLIF